MSFFAKWDIIYLAGTNLTNSKGAYMQNTEDSLQMGKDTEIKNNNTQSDTAQNMPSMHSFSNDTDLNPFLNGFLTALNEL